MSLHSVDSVVAALMYLASIIRDVCSSRLRLVSSIAYGYTTLRWSDGTEDHFEMGGFALGVEYPHGDHRMTTLTCLDVDRSNSERHDPPRRLQRLHANWRRSSPRHPAVSLCAVIGRSPTKSSAKRSKPCRSSRAAPLICGFIAWCKTQFAANNIRAASISRVAPDRRNGKDLSKRALREEPRKKA